MRLAVRLCVLALCGGAMFSGVARADIAPKWSDDELARFSAAIVTGRVVDVAVGKDIITDVIHTYVTVAVDDALKGNISERTIVVKQLGGQLAGDRLVIFGQPDFVPGENVLLFLAVRPRDRTLMTTALWQGKWTVERDVTTGEPIVTRSSGSDATRGIFRGDAERRTLTALASRLRALAQSNLKADSRNFVVEPAAEEMRTLVHSRGGNVRAFTLLGPARWNEFDARAPIPVDVQSTGQPGLAGGGGDELVRAASVWINATGLSMFGAGNTSRCFGAGSNDGRVSIVFNDPCGDIPDDESIIAVGGFRPTGSGARVVNGTRFDRIGAGYYVTNNAADVQNILRNSGCFQFAAAHELGHVLGLDHSADPSAIMYPSINFSRCSRGSPGPSADDLAGIRFIYPPASTPSAAPGAPGGLSTSAAGSTVTLSWSAPSSGGAPTAYIIEAGSSPGLANLANFSTGSTATTFSAGGVGAGSYYVRVKAINAAGASAPSNESLLIVGGGSGPCTGAPAAPTGFALTGNSGGTVSFAWNPSSGSPTTYIIEAGSVPGATNLANSDLGGTANTFTAAGVGRGTYYVRLRARNACGTSAASNEVTLIVP
jgi:hypothetical protein